MPSEGYQLEGKITLDDTNSLITSLHDESIRREEFKEVKEKVFEVKNPTQYIFVNKSLHMNPGKVAAQIAHAQEELLSSIIQLGGKIFENYKKFINQNPRTVIVLEAKDTDELYKIVNYLESCDIVTGVYVDEGGEDYLLEPTAFATEYVDKEDPRINLIFKNFKLYQYFDKESWDELRNICFEHWGDTFSGKLKNSLRDFLQKKTGCGSFLYWKEEE